MPLKKGPGTVEEHKEVGREQGIRVAKMVIARIYGIPRVEQATLLGTTLRMITKWTTRYRDEINELEAFARQVRPKPVNTGKMDVEQFKAALTSRFEAQLQVLDNALASWDTKLALNAAAEMNKILGLTTKTKVEHEGTITHAHKVVPAGLRVIDNPRIRRGKEPLLIEVEKAGDAATG